MANEKNDLEARFKALEERNAQLMAALEAKLAEDAPQPQAFTPEVLEAILTRTTKAAGQATEVLAGKLKPENVDHLHLGPFEHPEGGLKHPKPELKREVVYIGGRVRQEDLTYAEAIALNTLSDSLSRGQRRVTRGGKWKATVSEDDARLTLSVPVKTIDDRADLPPFLQIVQELTSGERALDAVDLVNELALLKLQLAEMQAQQAVV